MRELVLFDLDGTLVDRAGAFERWVGEFTAAYGLGPDAGGWMVAADRGGLVDRVGYFAAVKERFGLAGADVDALVAGFRARMPALVRCRPEDLAALDALRAAGCRVGVVTNGSAANQEGKLRRSGLAEHLDGWAVSEAEGVRKPDPELFRIAARRCGADLAGGGWFVGDSPAADVAGGRAAGLRTVWIRQGRRWPADGGVQPPDHAVDTAAEAAALVLDGA